MDTTNHTAISQLYYAVTVTVESGAVNTSKTTIAESDSSTYTTNTTYQLQTITSD